MYQDISRMALALRLIGIRPFGNLIKSSRALKGQTMEWSVLLAVDGARTRARSWA